MDLKNIFIIISSLAMFFALSQAVNADPRNSKKHNNNHNSASYNSSNKKHNDNYIGASKHRYKYNQNSTNTTALDLVYAGISAILASQYAKEANLHGYQALPPGIQKNIARGKRMPPGIAKKTVPWSLLSRLPKHNGYKWQILGNNLVLVSLTNAIIADVLYGVFD